MTDVDRINRLERQVAQLASMMINVTRSLLEQSRGNQMATSSALDDLVSRLEAFTKEMDGRKKEMEAARGDPPNGWQANGKSRWKWIASRMSGSMKSLAG